MAWFCAVADFIKCSLKYAIKMQKLGFFYKKRHKDLQSLLSKNVPTHGFALSYSRM